MPIQSRRELLRHSGCGLGALAFAGMLLESGELKANSRSASASPLSAGQPHFPAKAKRIIHLFMNGGPSQIDTFDPKHNLQALNGQPLPDSVRNALQPTQRKRVGNIFASPFPFARHGDSGLEISSLYPNVASHADELCIVRSMQGGSRESFARAALDQLRTFHVAAAQSGIVDAVRSRHRQRRSTGICGSYASGNANRTISQLDQRVPAGNLPGNSY